MKAEAAQIEKERDKAKKSTQLWKAAAFIASGSGIGYAIGGLSGAAVGTIAGALLNIVIPLDSK